MIDGAISIASKGWRVFPCSPVNKRPLTEHGFKDATSDPEKVSALWRSRPDAMVGIATGTDAGFFVVDIDAGTDEETGEIFEAQDLRRALEEKVGPLPQTLEVETPRGGRHLYFRMPAETSIGNRAGILPRIDVRGTGGYVIGAPSRMADGRGYQRINDVDIAAAPPRLVDFIIKRKDPAAPAPRAAVGAVAGLFIDDNRRKYANAALSNEEMAVRSAPKGQRNDRLNTAALKLGHLIGAGLLSESVVRGVLTEAAASLAAEDGPASVEATILSGLARGMSEPLDLTDIGTAGLKAPATERRPSGKPLILTSRAFVEQFITPDYLIDGILQRRFLYSFTALTGVGKTAIALLLAINVAEGRKLGEIEVEKARVLYLAGENPDDLRMRWMGMADFYDFDDRNVEVYFVPGVFNIEEMRSRIAAEVEAIGGVGLIIVDTSAAYFAGEEENSNTELGNYARMLRTLVALPGGPTVLVLCHPTKNATKDNLVPRGGGAFLNEVDGNLVAYGDRPVAEVHWQGKFRGPDFDPIQFEMVSCKTPRVQDSKGRMVPTVAAKHISTKEQAERATEKTSDQDKLLIGMLNNDGASLAGLAEVMDWKLSNGEPNKMKVKRLLEPLRQEKLVAQFRGTWTLTKPGKKEAERLQINHGLAGSRY